MDLKFNNQHVAWDKIAAPRHLEKTKMRMDIAEVLAPESPILTMAQGGTTWILDANYDTTDLEGNSKYMQTLLQKKEGIHEV